MSAPTWARDLVDTVCSEAGVPAPVLRWRTRAEDASTGVARRTERVIAVRAGRDPLDQRLTLLHELAHLIAPVSRRRGGRAVHHGRRFYEVAFGLYARHGIDAADAVRLESGRYRSALVHAARLGVPGAGEALGLHRIALRERPRRRWRVLVAEHRIELGRNDRWHVCVTCGQRVVGRMLSRVRRSRRPLRHVLMTSVPEAG